MPWPLWLWPPTRFNFPPPYKFGSTCFVATGFWLKRSRVHIFCPPTYLGRLWKRWPCHRPDVSVVPCSWPCVFSVCGVLDVVQGRGLVQKIQAKLLRSFVSRPCGQSLVLRFCWHQSKVHLWSCMGEHVELCKKCLKIASHPATPRAIVKNGILPFRNFSVSTAFTTTEEGAESPSAGVTFIADHPLLFSVLVKHSARCKWKVVVVTWICWFPSQL